MSDNASWSNETTRSRKTNDNLGIPGFFGLRNLGHGLPTASDDAGQPGRARQMDSRPERRQGRGDRDEEIRLNLPR